MTRYTLLSALAIALSIASTNAAAQSAHVHGEGRINIAIDGDRIFMALESAGADIVGFEHAPRSADEKSAVASATEQLGEPLQLLRFDDNANCAVRQASARMGGDDDEHEEHGEHAEHEEHGEHAKHEEHGGEESHASFIAEYEFECAHIEALGFIEFTYFRLFANAQSLHVVVIDARGQRSVEIDRADPVLRLAR